MIDKFAYHKIFNPPIAIPAVLLISMAIFVVVRFYLG